MQRGEQRATRADVEAEARRNQEGHRHHRVEDPGRHSGEHLARDEQRVRPIADRHRHAVEHDRQPPPVRRVRHGRELRRSGLGHRGDRPEHGRDDRDRQRGAAPQGQQAERDEEDREIGHREQEVPHRILQHALVHAHGEEAVVRDPGERPHEDHGEVAPDARPDPQARARRVFDPRIRCPHTVETTDAADRRPPPRGSAGSAEGWRRSRPGPDVRVPPGARA